MNGIKNFVLDNIRYFISGILLILIVLILVKCTNENDKADEINESDNVVGG